MNEKNIAGTVLNVLSIEDSVRDFEIIREQLIDAGYHLNISRVETEKELESSIRGNQYDIILADFKLPGFDAFGALRLCNEICPEVPFICVSGAIGEETAIELIKQGAVDYVLKDRMARLPSAVKRALDELKEKERGKRAEEALQNEHMMLARTESIAHVGSWKWDIATDTVTWSYELFRIFQRDPQEGAPSFAEHPAFYHPDDMARLRQAVEAAVADGTPYELELRAIRKDGETRMCVARGVAEMDLGGRTVRLFGSLQDVTDRKQAEEALKESEKQFRLLADNSTDVIWTMTLEGKFTYISPSITNLCGYTPQETMEIPFHKYVVESYVEPAMTEIASQLNKPPSERLQFFQMELQQYCKDGTIKDIEVTVGWLLDDCGDPIGIQGSTRDISSRRRAEEELRASEELFRNYLEYAPDGVYMSDVKGTFIYGNRKCEEIIGYRREELIGKNFLEVNLLSEKSLNKAIQLLQANMEGKPTGPDEIELISKEGRLIPVEINTSVVQRNGEGIVLAFVRDITERKRAEDSLKESEKKYRLLADNVHDVIFVLDMNFNYTYISPSTKVLRGYEPEEVMKQPFSKILTPSSWDLAMKTIAEALELEKTEHREINISRTLQLEMMRKDGTTVWTEVKFSAIRNENQQPVGILGVTRDITERRKAEAKLQQTLENLQKAVGATIQVMVSAVEMRDPYTAGHQIRVANLARAIATEMGLSQDKIEGIRMAGSIHDIGKLSIPAEILSKPTKLTNIEFSLIKEHSYSGYEMLKNVESPWPLAQIVYQHHERMDGSGYPQGLKGDEILMEARIMAVADVVESMASHRPYRPALGIEVALEEIEKNKGILYDNAVADACLKLFREKAYKLT